MILKIVIIKLLLFINCYNCSLFNYLQPHNYILSNNWRLSRDRPINIGWENENHKTSIIHSITTSYNSQYIISCSNDNTAKFHRVLMYPNLYPDWTHLYYGELKLRGYNDNGEIETIKCISTRDGEQLIVLSINNNSNNIYLDIYQKVELDFIENRKPIIPRPGREKFEHINQVYSNYNIVFPLDDYNEIWVNLIDLYKVKKYFKLNNYNRLINNINNSSKSFSNKEYNKDNNSYNNKPILELSPNGKSLLISYSDKIIIQQLNYINNNSRNNIIKINNNYSVKDIKFIPDNNLYNSFLLLVYDKSDNSNKNNNNKSLSSIKKNKIIIYKYNSNNGEWIEKELELPYILSNSIRMISNKERGDDYDCINNNNKNYEQPILVAFQDLDYTVHLSQIVKYENNKEYFIIIKSLPMPFHQQKETSLIENQKVLIDFSKDSTLISIQYPFSNIIYIYKKDSSVNGIFDFKLNTILDELPINEQSGDVLLFNLKYNYLVTNFGGHLSFFRDLVNAVSHCDKASRTKSFYLPSPPLNEIIGEYINNTNPRLILEQYGILKFDHLSLIQVKYLLLSIVGYILVYAVQKQIIQAEDIFISPFVERLLKKINRNLTITNLQSIIFYILTTVIFLFSFYEIINEPAFTNDWPAHIHHIDQFLNPPSHNNNSTIFKNQLITNNNLYNNNNHYFNSKSSFSSSLLKDQHQNNLKYMESLLPEYITSRFDFDYSHYMHYHGPNTYPGGFTYLYTILYYLSNNGQTLQIFQMIWAILELINFIILKKICIKLKLPLYLVILTIISNRLHLYNVRIVINDFPSTFLIHCSILLLLSKRYLLFSTLYSITVSLKLHTVFYSPAILFIFFNSGLSIYQIISNLSIMAFIQLLFGLPFLLVNPLAYISNAYDFSRTLLWEKTRNFKFVGRILYDMKLFNLLLLIILISNIIIFLIKYQRIINRLKEFESLNIIKKLKVIDLENYKYYDKPSLELIMNRVFVLAFISINFFAIVWARGLYTPFMCWYFYTFPIILYFADYSFCFIFLYWVSHEILFRANSDLFLEMMATFLFFNVNLSVIIRLFLKFNPHYKNNIKIFNLNNNILDKKKN